MIEQPLKSKKIKQTYFRPQRPRNYPNFHVEGISDDHLISIQNGGLDDANEFNCDMYNFGEMEDLPDSDRQMIPKSRQCRDYQ